MSAEVSWQPAVGVLAMGSAKRRQAAQRRKSVPELVLLKPGQLAEIEAVIADVFGFGVANLEDAPVEIRPRPSG